jgi:hypothetical protein
MHSFVEARGGDRKKWENVKRLWGRKVCALCGEKLEEIIRE